MFFVLEFYVKINQVSTSPFYKRKLLKVSLQVVSNSFLCRFGLQQRQHTATNAKAFCGEWPSKACGAPSAGSNVMKDATICSMLIVCNVSLR